MSARFIKIWKAGNSVDAGASTNFIAFKAEAAVGNSLPREMEKYAAEVPWFKYISTISRPWEDRIGKAKRGDVDDLVCKYVADWGLKPEETTGYLCGHRTW